MAIAAARAGKHVIVEKPLTGAFCDATEPPDAMLATALANADAVLEAGARAGVTLCYAEDFVYAPPVAKLRRLLDASGGAILELRAEESHSGSHAAYAPLEERGRRVPAADGLASNRRRAPPQALGGHAASRAPRGSARCSPRWRASRDFPRWRPSDVHVDAGRRRRGLVGGGAHLRRRDDGHDPRERHHPGRRPERGDRLPHERGHPGEHQSQQHAGRARPRPPSGATSI